MRIITLLLVLISLLGITRAQDETATPPSPQPEEGEPAPGGEPAPAAPPAFNCAYNGEYSIKTNAIQCGAFSKYLSYIYPRCDALRVNLLTKRQLYPKAFRAVWKLDGAYNNGTATPTAIESYKRQSCPATFLQDVPGTNLRMGILSAFFNIEPTTADSTAPCTGDVRIFSVLENQYLAVDETCSKFTLVDDAADAGASFKLLPIVV